MWELPSALKGSDRAAVVWTVAKVLGGMHACAAELSSIVSYCDRSQLATKALGEPIGKQELGAVELAETRLISSLSGPELAQLG